MRALTSGGISRSNFRATCSRGVAAETHERRRRFGRRNDENRGWRKTTCPLYSCAIIIYPNAPNPCSHHRSCVSSVPSFCLPFLLLPLLLYAYVHAHVILVCMARTRTHARRRAWGRTAVTQRQISQNRSRCTIIGTQKRLCVLSKVGR